MRMKRKEHLPRLNCVFNPEMPQEHHSVSAIKSLNTWPLSITRNGGDHRRLHHRRPPASPAGQRAPCVSFQQLGLHLLQGLHGPLGLFSPQRGAWRVRGPATCPVIMSPGKSLRLRKGKFVRCFESQVEGPSVVSTLGSLFHAALIVGADGK